MPETRIIKLHFSNNYVHDHIRKNVMLRVQMGSAVRDYPLPDIQNETSEYDLEIPEGRVQVFALFWKDDKIGRMSVVVPAMGETLAELHFEWRSWGRNDGLGYELAWAGKTPLLGIASELSPADTPQP